MRDIKMKVANMKKEQEFTLYPYSGGDDIYLQSDKRFARVNLRSGKGIIDSKNHNYPNGITLSMSSLPFDLPTDIQTKIQEHLWNNSGVQKLHGGILEIENKELFSE